MAKKDELPPMGLPLVEPSSTRYFFGIVTMIVICGGAILALGYGSLRLAAGPCDELYGEALAQLASEIDFFRDSATALGVGKVEIHELRTSARVARESLQACCAQRQAGSISDDGFAECREHAEVIEALPAELAAAHYDPGAAQAAVRMAASRLRGVADDLSEIADRSAPDAPGSVAAGPPSGSGSDD